MQGYRESASATAVWSARMRDFLHDCVASASSETADRLREARALFAQTGGRVAGIPAELPDPAAFEALLACEGVTHMVWKEGEPLPPRCPRRRTGDTPPDRAAA